MNFRLQSRKKDLRIALAILASGHLPVRLRAVALKFLRLFRFASGQPQWRWQLQQRRQERKLLEFYGEQRQQCVQLELQLRQRERELELQQQEQRVFRTLPQGL